MRAIYFEQGRAELRDDIATPIAGIGEVLLRPRVSGICGTDKALLSGYAQFSGIPGHEFVAEVAALGPGVDSAWLNRRVVCSINIGCGHCTFCQQGMEAHCASRRVIGIRQHAGAFADYVLAPLKNLIAVPDGMDDLDAVFAEPLAAAMRAEQQLTHHDYQHLLIIGGGTLGQLLARVFSSAGKRVSIVCRHPSQRAALAGLDVDICDEGRAIAPADVVIEASGSESGLARALSVVKPRGTIVIKSSYHQACTLDMAGLMVNEISLIGSRCGSLADALSAMRHRSLNLSALIDSRYPLSEFATAFARAQQPGVLKVLLTNP